MKKLILILITGLFFCTTSYGASISDLLGSKKGIKFACKTTDGDVKRIRTKVFTKKWSNNNEGSITIYEIKGKNLFEDERQICCGKEKTYVDFMNIKRTQELLISDNYYKFNSTNYKQYSDNIKSIERSLEINRFTGEFTDRYFYLGDDNLWEKGSYEFFGGTCEKATEQKF